MMPLIIRDDRARLAYERRPAADEGAGAFIFQHGMGGDRHQPMGYARKAAPLDVYAMDARGHGDSSDIVPERATFDAFADDVVALADHLELDTFVLGGISLGAAVSLNVAIRYPRRVSALLLCRPAWLDTAQGELSRTAYDDIAALLDSADTADALAAFTTGEIYQRVAAQSPNAAQSLRHQITRPRAALNADVLRRFPSTSPAPDRDSWGSVAAPTVVIGHRDDPFHSWSIAEETAARIPGAQLVEITSKDRDPAKFADEADSAIHRMLAESIGS